MRVSRPAETAARVLGVDGCRAGWVGALLEEPGDGVPQVLVAATVDDLVALAARRSGPVGVVAVDIPIGLPDDTRRAADVLTRRFLGRVKSSSVFTTPVRTALAAETYAEALLRNRERAGMGLSRQAFALRSAILDVDGWVRAGASARVVEVHPEASFAMMTGTALSTRKRTAEGERERRAALAGAGLRPPDAPPRGAAVDDLLDACAAAWTARRVLAGVARRFPDEPEVFSDDIPAAVHV